jgi:hypothetical protein
MVLLVEQERLYADELQLFSDAGPYGITAVADWTLGHTYTVVLTKQLIVFIHATVQVNNADCAARIDVDGVPVWSTGGITAGKNTPDIFVLLAAGSHTIKLWTAMWVAGASPYVRFATIFIGQLNFRDVLGSGPWDSGNIGISDDTVLLDKTVTIPAGRQTPIGQIQQYSLFVFVVAKDVTGGLGGVRATHMKNVGDSGDASKINVKLFINTVQVSWTTRVNDDADGNAANPTYGKGSLGQHWAIVTPNQSLRIQVEANLGGGGFETAEAYMVAFLCPWITIGVDAQPVLLSFSQGSTFYVYLEPLYVDSSKSSKIGKLRFKSFGDATDYYSIVSGTGILIHSYTFETVDVASVQWVISGASFSFCISYIGVDVR